MTRFRAWWAETRSRRTARHLERAADRAARAGAGNREAIQYLYERAAARTVQLEGTPWW